MERNFAKNDDLFIIPEKYEEEQSEERVTPRPIPVSQQRPRPPPTQPPRAEPDYDEPPSQENYRSNQRTPIPQQTFRNNPPPQRPPSQQQSQRQPPPPPPQRAQQQSQRQSAPPPSQQQSQRQAPPRQEEPQPRRVPSFQPQVVLNDNQLEQHRVSSSKFSYIIIRAVMESICKK